MSAYTRAFDLQRVERAREILKSYEAVGRDKLSKYEFATMESLRWITGESDTEPDTLDPEDWA